MSFADKARNDISNIGSGIKRLGLLGAKSFNDSIVRTLLTPADATTQAINLISGRKDQPLGERYQAFSDKDVAPAQNLGEGLYSAGVSALTGLKVPMPGGSAPKPTGALADTVAGARNAGYVMAPSNVAPSAARRVVEAVVGKKELLADATRRNMQQASKNIATDLKLPAGTEINPDSIDAVINREGAAYEAISSLGSGYADAIQTVKELRNQASKWYKQSAVNYSVEAEQKANEALTKAQNIDNLIGSSLKAQGTPELFSEYQSARQTIAKAYDVMRALVKSRGELEASSFAKDFTKNKPQSTATLVTGRTAEAFPGEFSTSSGSPWKGLDQFMIGSGIGADVLFHNPKYAAALIGGGVGRGLARNALLSEPYQNMLLLSPAQKRTAMAQAILRSGVAAQGQQ
jgi:hypothetical protein